ncbi:hypothetical protein HDU76_013706 [Blyttiomyces sp. JEL0837]|nr:hypothetical protein HDU76_013706 [Blyttiomyces sp. JEL0837]
MFEGIIAPVINKILGDYVANLETSQLSIGIWQGDVALHNLKLKREALDKFNLPVDVLDGYLGDLTLNIPWNDLKNKPVRVFINNVYLLAAPKRDTDYDPDLEEERMFKAKMEKIESAEMIASSKGKLPGTEDKQNASFMTQLITKIVDNLQITIKNIHIRYEDRFGKQKDRTFSFGITLSELSAVSTDDKWNEAFIHEESGIIHKLVRMESLAVYWNTDTETLRGNDLEESVKKFMAMIATAENNQTNHQFILKPVSGRGKLEMNKIFRVDQPRTKCSLAFDEIGFILDDEQYSSLLSVIDSFSCIIKSQQFRKFRPPRSITPSIDPLAWFKYAGTCILSEIHERNRRWTWAFFAERRDDRRLYIKLYKQSITSQTPLSNEDSEIFKALQRKLSYEDIRFYRSIATSQLRKEKTAAALQPTMKQLMETIDYDPKSAIADIDLPKEAILLDVEWELLRGSFAIKKHSQREQNFIKIVFETLRAGFKQHPASFLANLSLGSMTLTDGTTPDTLYPVLIKETQEKGDDDTTEHKPFFELQFEHNPLDDRADDAITLRMLPLQVIVNPVAISGILTFFSPPTDELEISNIQSVAKDTIQGLTAQTRAGVEYAIGLHRTVDLKVDLSAPIFIFPERDSMVVIVDAGHLLVESNLVNRDLKKEMEKKQGTELTEDDLAKLESLLYDRFTCTLSSVQVLVSPSYDLGLNQVKQGLGNTEFHFLEQVDVSFNIELSIMPKLAHHVRTSIAGKLPRLHINLSERKYKTIMKILNLVLAGQDGKPKAQAAIPSDWNYTGGPAAAIEDLVMQSDNDADSFFDAEENLDQFTDKKIVEDPSKILLEFRFNVGKVSASLQKSSKDVTVKDKTLAEVAINSFQLRYRQRPYDYNVHIQINSVAIEDRMQSGLVRELHMLKPSGVTAESTEAEDLVLIEYNSLKSTSPDYKGVDQAVNISFASVDIIVIKESVLTLYDFVLGTFTSGAPAPTAKATDDHATATQSHAVDTSLSTMVVRMSMKRINLIFIDDNIKEIATASFDAGQLSVMMKRKRMSVTGRLGNLSIVDNVERVSGKRAFTQLLRIEGSEVADFTLDTYNRGDVDYPGYDTSLRLRTASVRLTYIEPLLAELMTFLSEFQRMHVLFESARRAAVETQETAGKFHFDLHIETPIIELPDLSLVSADFVTMYLGKIVAQKSFESFENLTIDSIVADIFSMKLVSTFFDDSGRSYESQIVEDVNFRYCNSSLISEETEIPGSKREPAQTGKLDAMNNSEGPASWEQREDELSSKPPLIDTISDMHITIPSISLELFRNQSISLAERESIALFSLISLDFKMKSTPEGQQDMELRLRSINLFDTRKDKGNMFSEIMPSLDRSDDQFNLRLKRDADGHSLYSVTLDTVKLILVVDHVRDLQKFFNSQASKGSKSDAVANSAESLDVEPTVSSLKYRVNFVDVEIILLQDAKTLDSEAIILVGKEMVISYDVITTISMRDTGMFFTVMDQRNETTLRFIQNFDLTLVMDNRQTSPGHHLTNINVDISPLMLRVSYHDISLITSVWSNVMGLFGGEAPDNRTDEKDLASSPTSPKSKMIMSRERVQATTQGIRIMIIDDLNDLQLPMFDFVVDKLVIEVSDWSSAMRIDTGVKLHVNNFNIKNSHWEPLVEMFEFYLNVSRQDETLSVDIYARKKLEVNLSHCFVETALNTMAAMKQPRAKIARSNANAPYILRNKTGYDMHIWIESTGDGLDTELRKLTNNEEIPWRFDDWRVIRESVSPSPNKLSLQIHGPEWETLKGISVDREGTNVYKLRPNVNRIAHRLVCEVQMKKNMKIVTFRSTSTIQNLTGIAVDVMTVNSRGQPTGTFNLAPGGECFLPIESSYYDKVLVRPQDAAKSPSLISCLSGDHVSPPFRFQVNTVIHPDGSHLAATYPYLTMKLLPPFQLENLLPYDIRYVILDKNSRQEHRGSLEKSATDPIHTVDPTHSLLLSIEFPNSDFKPSEVAILSNAELDYRDEQITLFDSEGLELHLRIKYSDKLEFGGRKVSIYCPYVILNRTGLDLTYSARSLLATPRLAAGQGLKRARPDKSAPFMFSYTNFEPVRNRALVRVADSDWSKPLSFEAVGSNFDVNIRAPVQNQDICLGVTVREGEGKYFLTKIVTFTPRYVVRNNLDDDLYCRQGMAGTPILLKSSTSVPLYYFNDTNQGQLSLRMAGLMDEWSSQFNINQVGRIYVKLGRMGSAAEELIRAEVMLEDASIFIVFMKEEGRWPFRIENKSDVDIVFWQSESKNRYQVRSGDSRPYAWDNPSYSKKMLVLHVNGREREIDVREIGQLVPLKYPIAPNSPRNGIMAIQVYAEGPTLVISLGAYEESSSMFKQNTLKKDSSEEIFQMKSKEVKDFMTVQIRLEGIGISVINKEVKIDNQLYGALEPIFLYPTVLPKEGEEDFHPALMATLAKSKDQSFGVDYYHWFTILLQELSIDLDEDFLYALIDFAKFDVVGWERPELNMFNQDVTIPEPRPTEGDVRMYFEKFLLQPVQFNISFQRTHSANVEYARGSSRRNVLTFLVDVFTMTVGNIHDAPIRLNALEIYHPIVTFSQLVDLMMKFYSQEIVGQLHKVIGSADVLGNPVGLFNNVGSGVRDFFYEPIQGFEITRPQDFGIGLAKGTTSLFKKTVYGVTDTLSKFTGSVSKGLSVITLDEEFQEKRRLSSVRNRPRHAVYGVTAGATSLVTSVASGLQGVLSKPVEGYEKDGVGGFFKGLGKGLVGVVSKPLIGVFDLATNVTEGIKNTTTVFDKEIEKIRLPRFVSKDGILTPYDAREALGLKWLKGLDNGKYFHEEYFAHLELRVEDLVVIVTYSRVIMAKIRSGRVDWDIPYDDLQLVRIDNGGITLVKKGRQQARARIIPCPDQASAQWLLSRIEKCFSISSSNEEGAM